MWAWCSNTHILVHKLPSKKIRWASFPWLEHELYNLYLAWGRLRLLDLLCFIFFSPSLRKLHPGSHRRSLGPPLQAQGLVFYLPLRYHRTLPWLSVTISVNNALASPCVPLLQLWLNVSFSTVPAPHCIMEGSSWLSSSLIMQVWVSHGSWLRSQWQLASPCHVSSVTKRHF